ncbi:transposase [Pseudonocardia asaccharolytica DSM 44247 = NBRC 16224]|uniref:Transposase n=1 Tax=Pseudonocardia asaccharolytica DSM 44247 = NBRC 16224 TaxID=1123024 RepID=A0A511DA11_9PSEU|nr:transposase [Pseudonocardia asaccharolytica DSM 44247 = NBRC 16224]
MRAGDRDAQARPDPRAGRGVAGHHARLQRRREPGPEVAYALRTANKIRLQPEVYGELREQFGLSAQLAVRAIAKACEAYKRDKTIQPVFRPLGAVPFDQRILSWKGRDRVSILTLIGRIEVPVLNQGRWRTQPGTTVRGQADLIHRDGKFYLAVVIDVPDPGDLTEPPEWLGVDLGVVNIATDSDGTTRSGKALRGLRRQNLRLRRRLQATGTKSAKRLLRKRRRREARFARDVNHCISKALVGRAKDTGRGIAPEGLQGIRDRVSRACSVCGHVDKRNRPTRDDFRCVSCGHAAPADHNAAINIGRRAVVMQPNAA